MWAPYLGSHKALPKVLEAYMNEAALPTDPLGADFALCSALV